MKVPYKVLNIKRCRCILFPVQANSECAQEKYSKLKEELENSGGVEALETKRFPEFTVRQVLLSVKILILTDNAFAIPVLSGKHMNWRNQHR